MNLKDTAINYLNNLGDDEAVQKFNISRQTLVLWKKTGKLPLAAMQLILDAQSQQEPSTDTPPEPTDQATSPTPDAPEDAPDVWAHLKDHQDHLLDLHNRLKPVESGITQILTLLQGGGQTAPQGAPVPDPVTGLLPAKVDVGPEQSGTANLTAPSRRVASVLTEAQLNAADPNRLKKPVKLKTLDEDHWMRPYDYRK